MTLSLADIETWDEAAIEQVFSAATFRAEGAQTTGDTVGDLMTFVTWHGATADAARDSANRIKLTLTNHADECKRVAAAAHKASAEVADLKYRLSSIKAEASQAQLRINEQTGAVTSNVTVLTVADEEAAGRGQSRRRESHPATRRRRRRRRPRSGRRHPNGRRSLARADTERRPGAESA